LSSGRFKSTYFHLGVIASASEAWREAIQKKTPRFDGDGEAWIAARLAAARNDAG